MIGWRFSEYVPGKDEPANFEKLLKLFQELLVYTSGDVSEALAWLTELDKEYNLTDENYGMADFIQDLIDKGYIQEQGQGNPNFVPTSKMEIAIRQKALEDVFGLPAGGLSGSRAILRDFGNMSAATVMFVIDRALSGVDRGRYLASALGPGFTSAMLTLEFD